MNRENEGISFRPGIVPGRKEHEAFHLGPVLAAISNGFRGAERKTSHRIPADARDSPLPASIDRREEDVRRGAHASRGVGHGREVSRERKSGKLTFPRRHLRNAAAVGRRSKEMNLLRKPLPRRAGARHPDVKAGGPGRKSHDAVTFTRLPALEVHHLDVDGRTAVGFFRNEEREAFLAKKSDAAPVGGKDRRLMREPVVGQPTSLAARGVPLDEKQVGPLVDVFVALMGIGREDQTLGIRAPGDPFHVESEAGELFFLAMSALEVVGRRDVDLERRAFVGIGGIRKIPPAIEPELEPVVHFSGKPLLDLSFAIGWLRTSAFGRGLPDIRQVFPVGAEDRRLLDTAHLKRFTEGIGTQEPDRRVARIAPGREREPLSVRTVASARSVEAGCGDSPRSRVRGRAREPELASTAVSFFIDGAAREGDEPSVRRDRGLVRALDPVVVLDFEKGQREKQTGEKHGEL